MTQIKSCYANKNYITNPVEITLEQPDVTLTENGNLTKI